MRASTVGIGANILLAAFKAGVGLLAGSVAIVMDAVNNLSDVLSSVITIIGTKLANRMPDKNHPLGHGRIEYLSATIISFIVLAAGVMALVRSVKAIVSGDVAHYDVYAFIIMAVAVAVKLLLGRYSKRIGQEADSPSLIASGSDAMFDAVITAATIVSALLMVLWNVNIDGWLGAIIAVVIIRAGYGMIRDTLDDILGHRMSPEQSHAIKDAIMAYSGVKGAYDLLVNDYGPNMQVGSVHIEVDETMNAREIYTLTHRMQQDILQSQHVYLTFGIYALNVDTTIGAMRDKVTEALKQNPHVIQIHAFYVDEQHMIISFDVVHSFDVVDHATFCQSLRDRVKTLYPDYEVAVNLDEDISD